MSEIEEKYKKFSIDENMKEMFSHSSVEIEYMGHDDSSFVITTVINNHTGKSTKSKENKDA